MADRSYRDEMRTLIAARWVDLWAAIPRALDSSDIEGVHDVRVASRRLRAAMDVAAPAFPASWYRPLHRLAKQITSELGAVRDRDVMIEFLRHERASAPANEHPGLDRLIARIEREREAARAEMERFLASLDTQGFAEETRRRFPPEHVEERR